VYYTILPSAHIFLIGVNILYLDHGISAVSYCVKVESSGLYLFSFSFSFSFWFIFQFLELRVRVRVMRSHCHTSVTSDDTVTVTCHMSHDSWKNIEDSGKDDIIKHVQHMLTLKLAQGCLE